MTESWKVTKKATLLYILYRYMRFVLHVEGYMYTRFVHSLYNVYEYSAELPTLGVSRLMLIVV